MLKPRVKAVFFDLDGTLVDSVPDLAVGIDRMLASLGHADAGEARVRDWVGNGASLLVKRALAHAHGVDENAIDDAQLEHALTLFRDAYERENGKRSQVYPSVLDCLNALAAQRIPIALITNKPERFTGPLLRTLGLDHYFQLTLSGDSLPEKKPSPLPLQHAAAQLGIPLSHCLMVGDSITDVRAARAAGVPVICVPWGYNHGLSIHEAGADAVVDSLQGLL